MSSSAYSRDVQADAGKQINKTPTREGNPETKQKLIVKPVWEESAPDDIWPTYAPDTD